MSRVWESDGDNPACIMWAATFARAVKSPRGQKLMRELEAALLALPVKRLASGSFAESKREHETEGYTVTRNELRPTGEVCALGALIVERKMREGKTREDALAEIVRDLPNDDEGSHQAQDYIGMARTIAWEAIYHNDDGYCGKRTPEQRYEQMLAWVRSHVLVSP